MALAEQQAEDIVMKEVKNFIGGEYRGSSAERSFDNIDPCTGQLIGKVYEAGREDVDAAVSAAREALDGPWGRMTDADRSELLYAIADGVDKRFDEFLEAECLDTGKPHSIASHIDIPRGAANFRIFADAVKNVSTEAFRMPTPDGNGAFNIAVRKPKGVIGVISPWNLPLLLMTWKVGPALACGNTVVVKPSEETPTTTALLGEVMNEVGVPTGVYNVVNGFGPDSAGAFLTEHPGVDAITFTGETRTGEIITQAAARGLRDVSMECGGKNPALVFADCDMDKAIEGTLRSVFANCGQVCLGTERVYVERPIFDEFVSRLAAEAGKFTLGLPQEAGTNMGPVVSHEHQQKVLSYYALAVEEGAEVVLGGGVPDMPAELAGGAWVEPTIWTGLADDARAGQRYPLRAGGGGMDREHVPRPARFTPDRLRHLLGQQLVPQGPAYRLWRFQGIGHRP
jgi:aminomuconate-semialdehyde/2-hydroxymuconate-6-semialdehyde dehydrogenase